MKKIVSLVLVAMFSMLTVVFPQNITAAETEMTVNPEQTAFFETFAVFPNFGGVNDTFTRGEMAAVVANILNYGGGTLYLETAKNITDIGDCVYAAEVKTVVEYGIMIGYEMPDGTIAFRPDDPITVGEMVKVLVNLLEYEPLAQARGGYPLGYAEVAKNIHLLGDMELDMEASLGTAVSLVYKALHTALPNYSTNGEGIINNSNNNTNTYIEEYWNIVWDEGILQSNAFLSMDGLPPTAVGMVRINDNVYSSAMLYENMEYLGQRVRFYIDYNDIDKETIVCMFPVSKKNIKIYATAGDVFDIEASGKITVLQDNKKVTYNMSKNAFVYENYQYLGPADMVDTAYLLDILAEGNTADITLIDNDGDETFDFVWVRQYQNIVVKNFLYPEFKITGKYGEKLEMRNAFDKDKIFLWDENGALFNLKDIEKNIVLSLMIEQDSEGEIEKAIGFGSALQVSGRIKERSDDGLLINGENYLHTPEYLEQLTLNNSNVKELKIGMETTFLLNKFNMIAAINVSELSEEIESQIGFISKISKGSGVSDKVECLLYGTDGNLVTAEFSDKVTINGKTVRGGSKIFEELSSYGQQQNVLYRLVKYKMVDEKIIAVDIYAYNTKEADSERERDDELYPKLFIRSNESLSNTMFKSGTIGKRVGLTGSTIIFAVPRIERKSNSEPLPDVSGIQDDAIYRLSFSNLIYDCVFGEPSLPNAGSSAATNKMQMAFYDVDETMFANIAIRYYDYTFGDAAMPDTPSLNSDVLVVEKITQGVNDDGDTVSVIHGFMGGSAVRVLTRPIENADDKWSQYPALQYFLQRPDGTEASAGDIRPGDAVMVTRNSDGDATNFLVNVRAGNKEEESWLINKSPVAGLPALSQGSGNQYLGVNYGTVQAYDDSKIVLHEIDGMNRVYSLLSVNVTVFDREEKEVYKGTMADIEIGDDIYIRQYYSNIKEIVCYK